MEKDVPYIVHEGVLARMERINKRLIAVLVATIVLMFLSNAAWLYAWNQYDYESYEMTQDGGGVNIMNGSNNEVHDGTEAESQNPQEEKAKR